MLRAPIPLAAAVAALVLGAAWLGSDPLAGRVTHVRDGDTFELGETVIRVWGLDCPERAAPGGRAATLALRRLIEGRHLRCERRQARLSHGRVVAQCWLGEVDVAAWMVDNGCRDWPAYSGGIYARGP